MAVNNFTTKSMKELQRYLKDRGVVFSDIRKPELIDLCQQAEKLGIEVDPDGLLEDREEVLRVKLTTRDHVMLPNPESLQGTKELNLLPKVSIFDIYNYLITFEEYNHETLKEYQKMEGYGLFEDGYVLDVECSDLHPSYVALKSHVKPRTNEKDPISKLTFYKTCVIFVKDQLQSSPMGCSIILSAYCTCKGGLDGGCRHVVATLFEMDIFFNDRRNESVTSGPCLWVKRATKSSEPVLVTDLDTSLTVDPNLSIRPTEEDYEPIPLHVPLPDPQDFVDIVKETRPGACLLDAFETRQTTNCTPHIDVKLPLEKTTDYWTAHLFLHPTCSHECFTEFVQYMHYSSDDIVKIESGTQGQRNNENWQKARHGLLTSSNFKTICHSTNMIATAKSVLTGQKFDDKNIPEPILYGIKFENKARDMFIKSHRFRHRKCKVQAPGLPISSEDPILATSPDGIVDCSICRKFLIEVKCFYTYRNFHTPSALTLSKVCEKDSDGNLKIIKQHKYNYQIQGQMGISGIHKCILVSYTNQGVHPVTVEFDEDMWTDMKLKLNEFYKTAYLSEILSLHNVTLMIE